MIAAYKSYLFKDKDPIIYVLRDLRQKAGFTYQDIHDEGGPTAQCIQQWEFGATRRPQISSIIAVLRILGHDLAVTDARGRVVAALEAERIEPRASPRGKLKGQYTHRKPARPAPSRRAPERRPADPPSPSARDLDRIVAAAKALTWMR